MKTLIMITSMILMLCATLIVGSGFMPVAEAFGVPTSATPAISNSPIITSAVRISSRINLRSGPSTSHSIIKTLPVGTTVEIIENEASGWSRVRVNGTDGFIRSDLLQGALSSSTAIADARLSSRINLRSGPSTSHSIIRTLPIGTTVAILSNDANGWSKVSVDGTGGFIRSDLLRSFAATTAPGGTVGDSSDSNAANVSVGTSVAIASRINLRSGQSTNYSILRTLPVGTRVEIVSNEASGWSRVRVAGTYGFIRSDLLGVNSGVPQTAAPASGRYPSLTAAERNLVAQIVRLEAPNCCDRGKQAVAEVVLNRLISSRFGSQNTLNCVIFAPRQFAVTHLLNTPRSAPRAADYAAVDRALSGPNVLAVNYYFFNTTPITQVDIIWIGAHAFSR